MNVQGFLHRLEFPKLIGILLFATVCMFVFYFYQKGFLTGFLEDNTASSVLALSTTKVTSSSNATGYPVSNIIDNDPSTMWIASLTPTTYNNFAWVQFELPSTRYINRIRWQSASSTSLSFAGAMNDFVIKTSIDGVTWTPVYEQAGKPLSTDTGAISLGVNARYLRIESTKVGDGTGTAASIAHMSIVTSPAQSNAACTYTFSPTNFLSTSNPGGKTLNTIPSGTVDKWVTVCLNPGTYNVDANNPIVVQNKQYVKIIQTPGTTGTPLIQGHMPAYILLSSPNGGSSYRRPANSAPFTLAVSNHIVIKGISFKNTYTFDEVPVDQNQKTLSRSLSGDSTYHCASTYGTADSYGDYHTSGLFINEQKQNLCLSVITDTYSEVSNAVWITNVSDLLLQNNTFTSFGKQTVYMSFANNIVLSDSTVTGDYFILNLGGGDVSNNPASSGSAYVYKTSFIQDGVSSNEPWDQHPMVYVHNHNVVFDSVKATASSTGQSFIGGYQYPYNRTVIKGATTFQGSALKSWMDAFAGSLNLNLDPASGNIFVTSPNLSLRSFTVNQVGGNTQGSISQFVCTYAASVGYGSRNEPSCVNGTGTPPGTAFSLPVTTFVLPITSTSLIPLSSNVTLQGLWTTRSASLVPDTSNQVWSLLTDTSTNTHQLNNYLAVSGADTSDLWTLSFTAKPFGPKPPTSITGYVTNQDRQKEGSGNVTCMFSSPFAPSGAKGTESTDFAYSETMANGVYRCSVTVRLDQVKGSNIRIAFNISGPNDGVSGVALSNISLNASRTSTTPAPTFTGQALGPWSPQTDATLSSTQAPFTVTEGTGNTYHGYQQYVSVPSARVWRFTFEAKATGSVTRALRLYVMDFNDQDNGYVTSSCVLNGTGSTPVHIIGSTASVVASSNTSIGDGWYTCSETVSFNTPPRTLRIVTNMLNNSTASATSLYAGNGASGIMVRNPVLEYQAQ